MMGELPTLLAAAGTLVLGALAWTELNRRPEPVRIRSEDELPPEGTAE